MIMKRFTILSSESTFRGDNSGKKCLSHNVQAFYYDDYVGGGPWKVPGTIENTICTLKNDVTLYAPLILQKACYRLEQILKTELPKVLFATGKSTLRVCVIPRSKKEDSYRPDQLLFRSTIQSVIQSIAGLEDGTYDIIRHTDTRTTHLARNGHGGEGSMPYVGITNDTCNLSDNIMGKNILLIDDLYTKTVNIDEDCIQALYDKGAKEVFFYSIGKTINRF